MTKVTCTASGSRFEISCKCLEGEPFQRLPLMVSEAKKNGKPLMFDIDRPTERFAAIAAYYQTGELHIPAGVCPGAFQRELLYWDIDSSKLSDCCIVRYISFLEEQETARQFRHEVRKQPTGKFGGDLYIPVTSGRIFGSCRSKLWDTIDNNDSSVSAKIYFLIMFLLIMASIFSLALSTVEAFKRKLSKCEMIEYLEYTKHDDLIRIKQMLGNPSCESMSSIWDDDEWDQFKDFYYDDDDEKTDVATTWETSRETTEITTEQTKTTNFSPTSGGGGGVGSGGGAGGGGKSPSPLPIESSVPSVMLSTTESLDDQDKYHDDDSGEDDHSPPRHMRILIPDLRTTIKAFDFINIILMVCFSLDLLLRLVSCPSVLRYFLSVVNILDAIALVGTYIYVIVTEIKKDQKYVDNWLDVIEYLQILRTLRLFRLVKNVRATKVLVYAVKQSFKDLLILLMFLFIAVCTFASIVYFAESRDEFESIPTGWWWALVTLTTVGYGDVYPKTWVGRAVASACALTGVVLIALTLPIFVNNFLTLYQYAMVEEVLQGKQQRQEAQNTKETVSKIDVTPVNGVKTDAVMSKTNGNALTLASE